MQASRATTTLKFKLGAPKRIWRTTALRWLSVYAVILALSVMALIAFMNWTVTQAMTRGADAILAWQLIYFDTASDADLKQVILHRTEGERLHTNYFGLFSADGTHLAGDIQGSPKA